MAFSKQVADDVLVATGRHCALCHKYCGTKIELHHIVPRSDGGDDSAGNCIPLCFDCHAEVEHYNPKHPRGRKFTPSELIAHRDRWFARNAVQDKDTDQKPYSAEDRTLDSATYRKLRELLPSEGALSFIRTNNYAGFSFPHKKHDQLDDYVHYCANHPEFEFLDPDLEGLRADIRSDIEDLLETLAVNSWHVPSPADNPRNSIPQDWEIEQPERFHEVVSKVHGLTSSITDRYDALIRLARRRLHVQD